MEAIIVHRKNKEQSKTIATISKALKIPFQKAESENSYDPEFEKEILQAKEDIKNGKSIAGETQHLWK